MGPLGTLILVAVLAMLSAGGIAYFFLYGRIEAENKAGERLGKIQARRTAGAADRIPANDPSRRRKSVQDTLKEMEERQTVKSKRNASPPIALRLQQAGLSWSRRGFLIFSLISALVVVVAMLLLGAPLWALAAFGAAAGVVLPRWIVNFLRKRRIKKFLAEFANAIDVIVRGVKAGLPLNDCIQIIGSEASEPVAGEFRHISETQALGVPMAEAVARLPERVPASEANFFAIVIATQSRTGGNLSEALGNLSRVLRERLKMQGKIKAMSMEAKASAVIIGALPIIVILLVWITTPGYIVTLFTHPVGNVILIASGLWMLIGILVMRKMINFDF